MKKRFGTPPPHNTPPPSPLPPTHSSTSPTPSCPLLSPSLLHARSRGRVVSTAWPAIHSRYMLFQGAQGPAFSRVVVARPAWGEWGTPMRTQLLKLFLPPFLATQRPFQQRHPADGAVARGSADTNRSGHGTPPCRRRRSREAQPVPHLSLPPAAHPFLHPPPPALQSTTCAASASWPTTSA